MGVGLPIGLAGWLACAAGAAVATAAAGSPVPRHCLSSTATWARASASAARSAWPVVWTDASSRSASSH
ncbi:MAG TPA: hypothetical protein VE733_04425 [Streptosporangiaceae bacterium]|jgi:hypothetical protein|nr:hypothetical protein [Streptosporangiaceae bacterium]